MGSFLASLFLLLPLQLFFPRGDAYWPLGSLLRVAPVMAAFGGLLIYGVASASREWTLSPLPSPLSPFPWSALWLGGTMGACLAAVAAAVHFTVPERFRTSPIAWTAPVWRSHLEDVASRPGIAPAESVELHKAIARSYAATQPAVAAEHLRKAAAAAPRSLRVRTELGNAFFALGRLDDAIGQCRTAVEIDPRSAEAHFGLGIALAANGRLDDAIGHFQRAVELDPALADARNNFGAALVARGRIDDAISQYRRALAIRPDYAEAHNNLAAALASRGQLDEAMAHYRRALEIEPDYLAAHYNLGLALAGRGRFAEAIAHYQKALQLKPDYAAVLNELAWLCATCPDAAFRDGAAALDFARRAIQLSGGKTPELLDTLAAAYAESGMFAEAAVTVGEALDLARRQNKPALADKLKARLWLYDVLASPYREPLKPSAH